MNNKWQKQNPNTSLPPIAKHSKEALLQLKNLLQMQLTKDKIDLSNLIEKLDKTKYGGSV